MTVSMHIPRFDSGFRCGSFLETDVVDDKYSFELDGELYNDLTFYGNPRLEIFIIGKGPYHLSNPSDTWAYDFIIFHYYGQSNSAIYKDSSSEYRTQCTAAGRTKSEYYYSALKQYPVVVSAKKSKTTEKIKVDISFFENKEFSRTGYEYRYLAWFIPEYNSRDYETNNYIYPDSYSSLNECYVVNRLSSFAFDSIPAYSRNNIFFSTNKDKSEWECIGNYNPKSGSADWNIFPSFLYTLTDENGESIINSQNLVVIANLGQTRYNVYWPWIGTSIDSSGHAPFMYLQGNADRNKPMVEAIFDRSNPKIMVHSFILTSDAEYTYEPFHFALFMDEEDVTDG